MCSADACDRFFIWGDFNLPDITWITCDDDIGVTCMLPTNLYSDKSKYVTETTPTIGLLQCNSVKNSLDITLDLLFTDSLYEFDLRHTNSLLPKDRYHVYQVLN